MITKVEYGETVRNGEPGLTLIFTYDNEFTDAYEVWGLDNVNTVGLWLGQEPDPTALLVNLRHMVGLTVH